MAGRWPAVAFVETPDEGAAVRLDLNAAGVGVDLSPGHDEFSLGMGSLSGSPGSRDRVWGPRQLAIPVLVEGSRSAAQAVLRKVARECVRDGWMRWQLDATTAPVWFRVYATPPAPLSFDLVYNDLPQDLWTSKLTIDTDPFGVGAPVTLGPFTVTNNPTLGTNPMVVALPDIAGDVPTPAKVRVTRAVAGGMLGPTVGVLSSPLVTVTAANWTAVVDAASTASGYIAGSFRQSNAGVGADVWTTVATFTPSAATAAGRRRTALHLSGSSDVGAFLLRWVVSSPAAASQITTAPVLVSVATMLRWVDLGVIPFPLADGDALGVASTTVLTLQAKRVVTPGQLRFDNRLLLLPVESSTLEVTAPGDVGTAAADILVDAEQRRAVMAAGTNLVKPPAARGGWPQLRPDGSNVLFIAQNYDCPPVPTRDDSISSTTSVTLTYRPRSLWGVS